MHLPLQWWLKRRIVLLMLLFTSCIPLLHSGSNVNASKTDDYHVKCTISTVRAAVRTSSDLVELLEIEGILACSFDQRLVPVVLCVQQHFKADVISCFISSQVGAKTCCCSSIHCKCSISGRQDEHYNDLTRERTSCIEKNLAWSSGVLSSSEYQKARLSFNQNITCCDSSSMGDLDGCSFQLRIRAPNIQAEFLETTLQNSVNRREMSSHSEDFASESYIILWRHKPGRFLNAPHKKEAANMQKQGSGKSSSNASCTTAKEGSSSCICTPRFDCTLRSQEVRQTYTILSSQVRHRKILSVLSLPLHYGSEDQEASFLAQAPAAEPPNPDRIGPSSWKPRAIDYFDVAVLVIFVVFSYCLARCIQDKELVQIEETCSTSFSTPATSLWTSSTDLEVGVHNLSDSSSSSKLHVLETPSWPMARAKGALKSRAREESSTAPASLAPLLAAPDSSNLTAAGFLQRVSQGEIEEEPESSVVRYFRMLFQSKKIIAPGYDADQESLESEEETEVGNDQTDSELEVAGVDNSQENLEIDNIIDSTADTLVTEGNSKEAKADSDQAGPEMRILK